MKNLLKKLTKKREENLLNAINMASKEFPNDLQFGSCVRSFLLQCKKLNGISEKDMYKIMKETNSKIENSNITVKKQLSRKRHIAKTITWRIIGTIDTMLLGWLISGDPMIGLKVGGLELFTKMLLYYLHERVWYKSKFGIKE